MYIVILMSSFRYSLGPLEKLIPTLKFNLHRNDNCRKCVHFVTTLLYLRNIRVLGSMNFLHHSNKYRSIGTYLMKNVKCLLSTESAFVIQPSTFGLEVIFCLRLSHKKSNWINHGRFWTLVNLHRTLVCAFDSKVVFQEDLFGIKRVLLQSSKTIKVFRYNLFTVTKVLHMIRKVKRYK